MGLYDAVGQKKKHNVMSSTWGHLYPEPSSKHEGHIVLAFTDNNGECILGDEFPTLCGSPQRMHLVSTILGKYDLPYGVYKIHCTLWFFKTSNDFYLDEPLGRIIKPRIETIWKG